jgi:large subunit ribosomal protein L22
MPAPVRTNERPGTRATARHVRMSATKARAVLDLIRGADVRSAEQTLRLVERDAAQVVGKVLRSAIANAEHNDDQIGDDLVVSACYADEGRTIRRFRPRARGRATRIRKRTCHITIIVSRMSEEELERRRARDDRRPGGRAARRAGQQATEERRRRTRRRRGGRGGATGGESGATGAAAETPAKNAGTAEPAPSDEAAATEPTAADGQVDPQQPAPTSAEGGDTPTIDAGQAETGDAQGSGEAATPGTSPGAEEER